IRRRAAGGGVGDASASASRGDAGAARTDVIEGETGGRFCERTLGAARSAGGGRVGDPRRRDCVTIDSREARTRRRAPDVDWLSVGERRLRAFLEESPGRAQRPLLVPVFE